MHISQTNDLMHILRSRGLKVTTGRLQILTILKETQIPVSVEQILAQLKNIDETTVYRTLHTLRDSGLAREVHFKGGMPTFFELQLVPDHHHHIVCTTCGDIDELESCTLESFEKTSLSQSRKFSHITTHALEFFGVCKTCQKQS
jgi:Fe2+ or Zn2+ uptake regulation protein